jgi:TonB-linked SusC/RagA family outer membrane protein
MLRKLLFLSCVTGLFYLAGLSVPLAMAQQTGSIQGTVTDSLSGKTLVGTNIYIPDAQKGAATDAHGDYTINNIPTGTYQIRASFIGYETKTKTVTIGTGTTTVSFELVSSNMSLKQLVVIGQGQTVTKGSNVSAISTVNSKDFSVSTTQTLPQQLQGKVSGVQVTSTSGMLGAPVSVRVRGTTSINASSQPLYVIDGVPVVTNTIGFGLTGENQGGVSALQNLNPDNIASMTVLKGASATAIYGARGANGVVIITTKKGQAGHSQINIGVSGGLTGATKEYNLMTAPEWAKVYNYENGGKDAVFGAKGGFPAPEDLKTSNWYDLITRTGSIQNYNASVSGGNANTTYYISGAYNNQKGFAANNQLQKYDLLAKVSHQFNKQLHVGMSVNPSRSLNNGLSTENQVQAPFSLAGIANPIVPVFLPDGSVNNGVNPAAPLNAFSAFPGTPYSNVLGSTLDQVTTNIQANAHASYDFIPQLTLKTQFSVQSLQSAQDIKWNAITTNGNPNGAAQSVNDQYINYSWRSTLKYANNWKNNALTVLAGVTFQRNKEISFNVSGITFPSPTLKYLNSAAKINGGGGFSTSFAYQTNLLRIHYSFKDRYIVTLTGSYQGSSRFGSNNRYGFFPSGAVGWIISDENFAKAGWLSNLKIHAGFGQVGNSNINNFESVALFGTGLNYNSIPGIALTQLPSPNLSWETTNELDIGLDYGFINNRIRGKIGYYLKKTHGLLLSVPVSATNGFNSIIKNIGKIKNEGVEFSINADVVRNKTLTWSLNANISHNKNTVTSLPSAETNGNYRLQTGHPVSAFYLREYAGVNPNNGDALYYVNDPDNVEALAKSGAAFKLDKFGNRYVTNDYNDAARKFVGSPFPQFFGGFGTRLLVGGLDIGVNFQYQKGSQLYWETGTFIATNFASIFGQAKSQLNYWTPDKKNAPVPEPRAGGNGNNASTRYLLNSSYLRLKTATIGYTLPRQLVNGYKVRIYVQGANLLTVTPFKGLDPEVRLNSNSNDTQGSAFFNLPQARSVIFGIQLGF